MTTRQVDIEKRLRREKYASIFSPIVGAFMGLLLGSVFLITQGVNPFEAYLFLFRGAFIGVDAWSTTLLNAVPLAIAGMAVVVAFTSKTFNIGAEGQMYMGAIAATLVALYVTGLPFVMHASLMLVVAALAGGLFGLLPGYLKAYRGINEIVVTMLSNYIAIYFLSLLVQGPLQEPGTYYPRTVRFAETAILPFIPGTFLHVGVFFVPILGIGLFWMFKRTTLGFNIEASGHNPRAIEYAGVNVRALITKVMVGSGAIAGFAGAVEIMGVHRRLIEDFSVDLGYDAIAVALLANLNPLGVLLSAIFFGGLEAGAGTMQIATGIPVYFIYMVQAFVIFFVVMFQSAPRIFKMIQKRRLKRHG